MKTATKVGTQLKWVHQTKTPKVSGSDADVRSKCDRQIQPRQEDGQRRFAMSKNEGQILPQFAHHWGSKPIQIQQKKQVTVLSVTEKVKEGWMDYVK